MQYQPNTHAPQPPPPVAGPAYPIAPKQATPAPSVLRWVTRRTLFTALWLAVAFVATGDMVFSITGDQNLNHMGADGSSELSNLGVLVFMLHVFTLIAFFILKRRAPVAAFIVVAAAALLSQVGLIMLCAGLVNLLARSRDRNVRVFIIAAWVVGVYVVLADAFSPIEGRSLSQLLSPSAPQVTRDPVLVAAWIGTLVGLLVLACATLLGWLLRANSSKHVSEVREKGAREEVVMLHQQVARQHEHEILAREVHDGLASQLSLLSLHAMELRKTVTTMQTVLPPGNAGVPQALRTLERMDHTVRGAHQDLSQLIALLREPGALAARARQVPPIRQEGIGLISELVAKLQATGVPVSSNISIENAQEMSPQLGFAVYRVVQEALANIAKHAQHQQATVMVTASMAQGVRILVENDVPTARPVSYVPSGKGIIGMQERVALLGGKCFIGLANHGRFVVDASLPWLAADAKQGINLQKS